MSSDESLPISENEDNDISPVESDVEPVEIHENEVEPVEQPIEVIENVNNENEQENENQEEEKDKKDKEIKVKRVRNPQPKLDVERLRGPRGIRMLEKAFKDVKFKGRGHEEEDLTVLMKNYEYWCHRMFPKFPFDDCLERMEKLGHKHHLQSFLKRIRMNMETDDIVPQDEDEIDDKDLDERDVFDNLLPPSTSQPNNADSVTLTEEQLQRITLNREKAQRLRQEMLTRNKPTNDNVIVPSTDNNSDESNCVDHNMLLSQLPNITNNSTQFIVEAEIHRIDNINELENPLDKGNSNDKSVVTDLTTVERSEPNIVLSQITDIDDSDDLVVIQTDNGSCEESVTTDIEVDADQQVTASEPIKQLPSKGDSNEINASSILDKRRSHQRETFKDKTIDVTNQGILQQYDNVLSEDIIADFMNEEFDIIQKNVNQTDLLKKPDTNVSQKENIQTNKNEDSLAMEIDM